MTKYEIKPLENFFQPSTWTEDLKGSFGLHPTIGSWAAFKRSIEILKANCTQGESIKVVFLARHGHGQHNEIHEQYPSWEQVSLIGLRDNHRRTLRDLSDEEAKRADTPHDAALSPRGIAQGQEVAAALQREVLKGMPTPSKWFVSSLRRTGDTCGLEWGWLYTLTGIKGAGRGVPATVIENLRESLSGGKHNSRSTKTHLQDTFPSFTFPPEMTETDDLWVPNRWDKEPQDLMVERVGKGFEQCPDLSEGCTYISITSHKTASERLRIFLGLEERTMALGEMNILVLKVKRLAV